MLMEGFGVDDVIAGQCRRRRNGIKVAWEYVIELDSFDDKEGWVFLFILIVMLMEGFGVGDMFTHYMETISQQQQGIDEGATRGQPGEETIATAIDGNSNKQRGG